MRKMISITEKKENLNEGFRAGKTPEMIVKLMGVIGKKAGISGVVVSPVPDYYANKYGSFIGFFVKYNGLNLLRFNFLKSGSSNKFYSIDKYDLKKMKPDFTIDLKGYNVVEVVDYVSDILTGEFWQYTESTIDSRKRLKEAISYFNSISEWLDTNEEIKNSLRSTVASKNRGRIDSALTQHLPQFQQFLATNRRRDSRNAMGAFKYNVKKYFSDENVDTSGIPAVEVVEGVSENLVSPSSQQQQAYDSFVENEHIFKFKALRTYCFQIRKGNKNFKSLYIYGDGGIGKSYWVKKILGNLPNTKISVGHVGGYTGLIQLLYDNREGKILVLDDKLTGKDMANEIFQNILKAILDPSPPRKIEVSRRSSRSRQEGSYFDKGKFYLDEDDYDKFDKWKKSLKEETDFVDLTEPISADTPDEFLYNSVTIFITNYKKVPQPIEDRCWILQMEFNNKQILDLIEESLTTIIPNGNIETLNEAYELIEPDPTKQQALDLLRGLEASSLIPRKLSFRIFNRIVVLLEMHIEEDAKTIEALIRINLGN